MATVSSGSVATQNDLVEALSKQGFEVTQATLSRDLKALGIGKVPREEGGYAYVLSGVMGKDGHREQPRSSLEIEAFVREVKAINNLLLIRTTPGNAHGVGRAMDELGWEENEGSIAGDDTLLVVAATPARARRLQERVESLMAKGRRRGK